MKCKCGRDLTTGDLNGMCAECFNNQLSEKYCKTEKLHTGWECPKCGFVWAPQVEGCDYCNAPQMIQEISIDDGGTNHADKTKP